MWTTTIDRAAPDSHDDLDAAVAFLLDHAAIAA
jgi:hypothetical protein